MSDDASDLCFECLGEATWCSACKKGLPSSLQEKQEGSSEETKKKSDDPNQLPLL